MKPAFRIISIKPIFINVLVGRLPDHVEFKGNPLLSQAIKIIRAINTII
jgi:hypothetical protein